MHQRINPHKLIEKKEVSDLNDFCTSDTYTETNKFSTNSQNKPFTRKPVSSKRNSYVSPTYMKTQKVQISDSKRTSIQCINKRHLESGSHSEQDYNELQLNEVNISMKKSISTQQNVKLPQNALINENSVKKEYFAQEVYARTQIGDINNNFINEGSDGLSSSQKDLYTSIENMKKLRPKEVVHMNGFRNSAQKKMTRTEYFTQTSNDETRSITTTSNSIKGKQTNFTQLKIHANNNIQAYIISLQQIVKNLQRTNYKMNKKCQRLHQQVEMHLEKQNMMTKQNQLLAQGIKNKQNQIENLNRQIDALKKEIQNVKAFKSSLSIKEKQSEKPQSPSMSTLNRFKPFNDTETFSSLKQLAMKKDQFNLLNAEKSKNLNQTDDKKYLVSKTSFQSEKQKSNKKLSFKTYPGVRSPRNRKQDLSKCSSILGSYDSYNQLGEISIIDNNQSLINKRQQSQKISQLQLINRQLQNERDLIRKQFFSLSKQFQKYREDNALRIKEKEEHSNEKLITIQLKLEEQAEQKNLWKKKNERLKQEMEFLTTKHQSQIQSLNFKIKQLQDVVQSYQVIKNKNIQSSSLTNKIQDFELLNPLQFLFYQQDHQQGLSTDDELNDRHIEQENKSLRKYIQQMLQYFKYIKIENRMLLKLKQDLQKSQKEKKQIKEERDMFKKKLLDNLKNVKNKGNNKGIFDHRNKKNIHYDESDLSEDEDETLSQNSNVLELSESEIVCHSESQMVLNTDCKIGYGDQVQ